MRTHASKPDPSQKAARDMQDKWYNVLVAGTSLTPERFQLVQGRARPLENDDELWTIRNSVPPTAVTHNFQETDSSFFAVYEDILADLEIPADPGLETVLDEDELDSWLAYRADHATEYIDDPEETFEIWGVKSRLSREKIDQGVTALEQQDLGGVVGRAVDDMHSYVRKGNPVNPPMFTSTYDELDGALDDAPSYDIHFDSNEASSDVTHTWAKGEAAIKLFGLLTVEGEASYDDITKKAFSEQVTVDAHFDHFTSFGGKPDGWYRSDALALAYQHRDGSGDVWKARADPDLYFGDDGTLLHAAPEIVAVKGIDATVTVHASFDESERKKIEAKAKLGIWPFLSVTGEVSYETETTFHEDGSASFHVTSSDDAVELLGVNVLPIDQFVQ